MSGISDIRLTHKGRAYVVTRLHGPGDLRQISNRIAHHLMIDPDLFWEADSPVIFQALTELVKEGKLSLDDGLYRCVV